MIKFSARGLFFKVVNFPVAGLDNPVGGRVIAVVGLVLVVAVPGLVFAYPSPLT